MQAIADLLPQGSSLGDIGCDHGYLPIALLQEGKITSAIAADVNQGPLERAKANIQLYGLENKIAVRLSDGLAAFSPGEVEMLTIAGMGGNLMMRILSQNPEVVAKVSAMVLQPQSELTEFRKYLAAHDLKIQAEDMILEDGKYYNMFRVIHGREEVYTERVDFRFGRLLLEARHPILKAYLDKLKKTDESILNRISAQASGSHEDRIRDIKEEMEDIAVAMNYYEV